MPNAKKNIGVSCFLVLLVSCVSFLVSGCGWQPLYGKRDVAEAGVEDHLALVEIGNIPNQEGQFLRNLLIDRFYLTGRPINPAYNLDVKAIRERLIDLDITVSADTTRGQLQLETEMVLSDKVTRDILLKRKLKSITSYNILGSEFATRVSENNARENALRDLSRQIELQINLYLKRQN